MPGTRSRAIIHLNVADFAARVETCLEPSLRDYPLVIAPTGAPRAVVYDMNEQAFREGIRKGMALARAKRLNRGIRVLPPRFNRYEKVMKDIIKQALAYTPAIESGERDGHLFLDITGTGRLYGPPPDVAFRLRKAMKKDMGLDPIWSLATNKLVAKVATRVVKPVGEYIVGPGEEEAFLGPLPVTLLPGLSREEIRTITRFNLACVSQARALTPAQLSVPFARRAGIIHRLLRGEDPAPVVSSGTALLKAGHEFADDTNEADELKAGLSPVAASLCRDLRTRKRLARRLTLAISYSDGICHKGSAPSATANEMIMFKQAWALFLKTWKRRVRIRHIALSCITAPAAPVQADLFAPSIADAQTMKTGRVVKAMDKIKTRFGKTAIQTGAALRKPGRISTLNCLLLSLIQLFPLPQ
ncbi:MAG: hypothetical protein MI863_04750 [Desulfobacterales bacterium]|nr:hypothetical protein [Desulfobacterales bacterium]